MFMIAARGFGGSVYADYLKDSYVCLPLFYYLHTGLYYILSSIPVYICSCLTIVNIEVDFEVLH